MYLLTVPAVKLVTKLSQTDSSSSSLLCFLFILFHGTMWCPAIRTSAPYCLSTQFVAVIVVVAVIILFSGDHLLKFNIRSVRPDTNLRCIGFFFFC